MMNFVFACSWIQQFQNGAGSEQIDLNELEKFLNRYSD